jgi:hypothetical protein
MVNEFQGGTYSFSPGGVGSGNTAISGETWLANFGVEDLSVKTTGIFVLLSLSAVLLVITYAALALRKFVK